MTQILEAPGLRYELILTLKDFAEPELHKSMFCSQEKDDCFYACVDESIMCIFDVSFEDLKTQVVGVILRDMNEVEYMRRLGVKLRELLLLIQKNGRQKDSFYMNSILW